MARIVTVLGKEFKIPKRYADKRRVEKEIRDFITPKKKEKPIKKRSKHEITIPIRADHKTVYYVRLKNLHKPRWAKYIGDPNEYIRKLLFK